jgi:hypothetical protein
MSPRSAEAVLISKVKLGADASASAVLTAVMWTPLQRTEECDHSWISLALPIHTIRFLLYSGNYVGRSTEVELRLSTK